MHTEYNIIDLSDTEKTRAIYKLPFNLYCRHFAFGYSYILSMCVADFDPNQMHFGILRQHKDVDIEAV